MISDRMAMLLDRKIARVDTVEGMKRALDPRIHTFVHGMDLATPKGL
jgi:ABC-type transporter Mla maintaining outer membrane lipid asymmetry ATPase subunit MlaF